MRCTNSGKSAANWEMDKAQRCTAATDSRWMGAADSDKNSRLTIVPVGASSAHSVKYTDLARVCKVDKSPM